MFNPQEFFKIYDDYCFFQNPANGFGLMSKDEYHEYMCCQAEYEAEQYAESAWLRHAEMGSMEDYAFERYEHERMY